MANYLPVLLVSVNSNSIPDDNVLTTMPCGQVDYLSHDWQEEDVWRSWRNMTRQKNEIANGLRLENASWRTWWKQRNKLKTVSPETLNWLKDSDVTWLYGPLHTAVDWSPPPRPEPVPDSVDSGKASSTQDRLDLHSLPSPNLPHPQQPRTKPILKHRSISELLTSDLPISPIFSPQDSEDESNQAQLSLPAEPSSSTRPSLPHTKSDTHITRWGPSRAFRKDSPPRVPPPTSSNKHSRQSTASASGAVRSSLSQDSNSSTSGSGSTERTTKKKHISFNTFVEQCIAIDKHPRKGSRRKAGFGFGDYVDYDVAEYEYSEDGEEGDGDSHTGRWVDDDGYEEDREDNFFDEDDPLWLATHGGTRPRRRHLNGSAIHSDSDSDDGAIEIRPSAYRHSNLAAPHAKKKPGPRSKSVSSESSTTTTTTSSTSSTTCSRPRRKSASAPNRPLNLLTVPPPSSAYRPRPSHSSHTDPPYRDRVTIAPIAPTLLKTTGAWEEGFGDEDGASDDGLWDFGVPGHGVNGRSSGNRKEHGNKYEEDQGSDGTPVELVYVPPFGSMYGYEAANYWQSRGAGAAEDKEGETDEVEELKSQLTAVTREDGTPRKSSPIKEVEQASTVSLISPSSISTEPPVPISRSPVPVVIIDSSTDSESTPSESSEKTDSHSHSSSSTSTAATPVPVPSRKSRLEEEERGRGRGRSLSVSPVGGSSSKGAASSAPNSSLNNGLLTSRGRSQSCQDLQSFYGVSAPTNSTQAGERRGRSSMRGSLNSGNTLTSGSMRGVHSSSRSSQSHSSGRSGGSSPNVSLSTSPIGGSLSPDGSDARLGGIGSAYASGRLGGRERERIERVSSSSSISSRATSVGGSDERRGRDRGRRDIGSCSGSSATTGVPSGDDKGKSKDWDMPMETGVIDTPKAELDASISSLSSEGSTATIVPTSSVVSPTPKEASSNTTVAASDVPSSNHCSRELEFEREAMEEAERRKNAPVPPNSPIVAMTAPHVASTITPSVLPPAKTPSGPSIQTQLSEHSPRHVRTSSSSSTYSSKSKAKSPPPIVPSPPSPSLPSTSPDYAPGEVGPSIIFTGFGTHVRSASTSLERASSGSRERHSPSSASSSATIPTGSRLRKEITPDMEPERELAEARRGRNNVSSRTNGNVNGVTTSTGRGLKEPTSPVIDGHREKETIIDKAVGMVSSAGAYLRLWPNQSGGGSGVQ
ncbi:hypothetical protein AN958_12825 [Leucoagaricus sp. SymC.cos]|nr:hypothetical protein AN958_12825 [Leucoagaricus sp. SymC.cos]